MRYPLRSLSLPSTILFVLASVAGGLAQSSSTDDVHVVPRSSRVAAQTAIVLATATPGPRVSGAVIRTSADLVMVPVTVTDEMNRPVVGLDQTNFELFENKKQQD